VGKIFDIAAPELLNILPLPDSKEIVFVPAGAFRELINRVSKEAQGKGSV
jgi:hypothetical protein